MQTLFLIVLFILGACLGSFLCCQARRLHLREDGQSTNNTKATKSSSKKSAKSAKNKSAKVTSGKSIKSTKGGSATKSNLGKWSVCLHCHKRLAWYDNIPIVSWLVLRGKCRECGKPIGLAEILSELGVAIAFFALGCTIQVTSANLTEWLIFLATLIFTLSLAFLSIYDGLYGKLPTSILIVSIILGIIVLAGKEWSTLAAHGFSVVPVVIYPITSILILGGTYLFLYILSHGKWIGDGDWILCTGIALALANPWLALIVLFLANALACLVMYSIIKKQKTHKIHFGPFLAIAFIIVTAFAKPLIALSLF